MNAITPIPAAGDAQQLLAAAVAHQIERMSKDEVQALAPRSC